MSWAPDRWGRPRRPAAGRGGYPPPGRGSRMRWSHGDEGHAEALRIGDEVGELRRLAGPGQGDDHVVGLHHAEVAVAGLGRVHVMGGGAGGRQGGRDLARRHGPTCPCPTRWPVPGRPRWRRRPGRSLRPGRRSSPPSGRSSRSALSPGSAGRMPPRRRPGNYRRVAQLDSCRRSRASAEKWNRFSAIGCPWSIVGAELVSRPEPFPFA